MSSLARLRAIRRTASVLAAAGVDREVRRICIQELYPAPRPVQGMGRPPRHPDSELAEAFLAGLSVLEVVTRFGYRDARSVRKRIDRHLRLSGTSVEQEQARRDEHVREAREREASEARQRELLRRMANAKPCDICGSWVLRGEKYKRCSPECSKLSRGAERYWFSEEQRQQHRVQQAKTVLRRPEKYKPSLVALSKRVLSDNPPPPNRTWIAPHKKELARRLGVLPREAS